MSSTRGLLTRTLLVGVALVPLTALTIYLTYGPETFSRWPWLQFSVAMALLTCLWTYSLWFAHVVDGDKDSLNPFVFAFLIIPLDVLILYPGTRLGIYSDSRIELFLLLTILVHGGGFYFLHKGIQRHLRDEILRYLRS